MDEEIKNLIKDFLLKVGVEAKVKIKNSSLKPKKVLIQTQEASLLIGAQGQTLRDLEHLLRVFVSRQLGKNINFIVDVNDYRKSREAYLRSLAHSLAQKVSIEKKPVVLAPMNAFERRIIHTELAARPDILTESQGEEPKRRVIIKPYQ